MITGCLSQKTAIITVTGHTMGTTYMIKAWSKTRKLSHDELRALAMAPLQQVNELMSTYRPHSPVSLFNQSLSTKPQQVHTWILEVVTQSLQVAQKSENVFDITAFPLIELWGFGVQRKLTPPSHREIQKAKKKMGISHLVVDHKQKTIQKKIPELGMNLSGIAKGFSIDKVAEALKLNHIHNFFIEVGGEISVNGNKPGNKPWIIGLEKPSRNEKRTLVEKFLLLHPVSMASSGDYRNYYQSNGKYYSHTINPVTGTPVTHNLASVTVFHKSCSLADAWATALMVLGPDLGYQTAIKNKLGAYFILRLRDGSFHIKKTPSLNTLLRKDAS